MRPGANLGIGRDRRIVAGAQDHLGGDAVAEQRLSDIVGEALRLAAREELANAAPQLPEIDRAREQTLQTAPAQQPLAVVRPDRRGGRGAFLGLDQPGIGEDQAVQARFIPIERQRGGAVAEAEAGYPGQPRHLAAKSVCGRFEIRPASPEACVNTFAVPDPPPVITETGIAFICQCLGKPFIHPV